MSALRFWFAVILSFAAASPAHAQLFNHSHRICVDILTNFSDADYTGPIVAGDYWTTNAARPARGVEIVVNDDGGITTYNVGNDGCIDVTPVHTDPAHPAFTVKVRSKALVNGVDIIATDGSNHDDPSCIVETLLLGVPLTEANCPGVPVNTTFQVGYPATTTTLTLSDGDQRWNLLAVAAWAMFRNTFHLGTYSARGCCLDNSGTTWDPAEGTCVGDPNNQYRNDWSATQGAMSIEMMSHGSGRSLRKWVVGGVEDSEPTVGVTSRLRFQIAHELGHVIVMKRMGKRTQTVQSAPLHECLSDYAAGAVQEPVGDHLPIEEDVDGDTGPRMHAKGAFTKEYQSVAAREGWGNFFAVWLFNNRTQLPAQMDWWTVHDFDRDGRLDNNYGDTDTADNTPSPAGQARKGDGIVEMGFHPVLTLPGGHAPLAAWANGADWLENLKDAPDAPAGDPTLGCHEAIDNRGTAYDWTRFFWDMTVTTEGNIRPEDLANLYVDMCPTNWQSNGIQGLADVPIVRLRASAIHQGGSVEAERVARESWGQDH